MLHVVSLTKAWSTAAREAAVAARRKGTDDDKQERDKKLAEHKFAAVRTEERGDVKVTYYKRPMSRTGIVRVTERGGRFHHADHGGAYGLKHEFTTTSDLHNFLDDVYGRK